MQFRWITKYKELAIVTFIAILLASTPLHANRILVIGDSWAEPIGNQLQTVLNANEHTDIIVETTPIIYSARGMASPDKLGWISTWLEELPDTNIVHLSIGGNDWNDWTSDMADTQEEADLFAEIMANVETIVDYIFSIRPDIRIAWSSYDFGRPDERMGTPTELNSAQIRRDELAVQLAVTKPGLSYVNIMGTMQVKFGFNGIQYTEYDPPYVIPTGDPSLPDPTLPSPYKAFNNPGAPLHPSSSGYKAMAQAQYDGFYGPLLDAPGFEMNAGLNDAWYDPLTDGQGFFITVFPDLDKVSLAWFTYDTELPPEDATANLGDPGHRWMTAIGPIDGNQVNMNIEMTSGGLFDTATVISRTDPPGSDGTIVLTFDSCNSATIEYDIPSINRQGTVSIRRVADDNIVLCEALKAD